MVRIDARLEDEFLRSILEEAWRLLTKGRRLLDIARQTSIPSTTDSGVDSDDRSKRGLMPPRETGQPCNRAGDGYRRPTAGELCGLAIRYPCA